MCKVHFIRFLVKVSRAQAGAKLLMIETSVLARIGYWKILTAGIIASMAVNWKEPGLMLPNVVYISQLIQVDLAETIKFISNQIWSMAHHQQKDGYEFARPLEVAYVLFSFQKVEFEKMGLFYKYVD